MPRMGGLELLRALQDQLTDLTFILLTAQGTVESAVEAIKDGAYDYLSKPVDPQRLQILLQKAVERQETLREVRHLRRQLREQGSFGRIIGNSPAIRTRLPRDRAGGADRGVGADLRASRAPARSWSRRRSTSSARAPAFPFVAINCAAIPETLLESEIFGHEKGAFTGAHRPPHRRASSWPHRGTLFLDEIAEMTPATQVKLLRVLQERTFRRLGGRQEQSVDVRVIAATNVDPHGGGQQRQAARGPVLPPQRLRARAAAAARPRARTSRCWSSRSSTSSTRATTSRSRAVDQEAMYMLERYPWPGNIRELRNVIERATILADGEFIEPEHLPPTLVTPRRGTLPTLTLAPGTTVEEAERRLILLTLDHTRNNKTRAAEILGISLKTLHNKLNRMKDEDCERGISRRRGRPPIGRRADRVMSIKAKQVAGVTTLVVRRRAGAERLSPGDAGAAQPRGDASRVAQMLSQRDLPARPRGRRRRGADPYEALRADGGAALDARVERRLLARTSPTRRSSTSDGVAVAHARSVARRPAAAAERRTSRRWSRPARLRSCARSTPTGRFEIRQPLLAGDQPVRRDPDRGVDAAHAQRAAQRAAERGRHGAGGAGGVVARRDAAGAVDAAADPRHPERPDPARARRARRPARPAGARSSAISAARSTPSAAALGDGPRRRRAGRRPGPPASTDLESVMDNLEDAVALFSPRGELMFTNAAMRAAARRPRSAALPAQTPAAPAGRADAGGAQVAGAGVAGAAGEGCAGRQPGDGRAGRPPGHEPCHRPMPAAASSAPCWSRATSRI